jgi:hypothetical protein
LYDRFAPPPPRKRFAHEIVVDSNSSLQPTHLLSMKSSVLTAAILVFAMKPHQNWSFENSLKDGHVPVNDDRAADNNFLEVSQTGVLNV